MEELIRISRVTSNDQTLLVYLPKKLTEKIGIKKGTWIEVYSTSDGCVRLKPVKISRR